MMKKFLYQVVLFLLLLLIPFILGVFQADGDTDEFYLRFTIPRQTNLIIGASGAAQGLQPQMFSDVLNRNFFNYSFSLFHSPYGPAYLGSIKKKLDKTVKDGIFVLSVTPPSLFANTYDPNDSLGFRELNYCVAKTSIVNQQPNFLYFYQNYDGKYYKLFSREKGPIFLHDDGWCEVSVPMDSISANNRFTRRAERYNKWDNFSFSPVRFEYLIKTIEYLRNHGKVYLVRLPIHPEMMELENKLMPDFEEKMETIIPLSNGYYDMTSLNDQFSYTDGFHLYKDSGKLVSANIATWIKLQNEKMQP